MLHGWRGQAVSEDGGGEGGREELGHRHATPYLKKDLFIFSVYVSRIFYTKYISIRHMYKANIEMKTCVVYLLRNIIFQIIKDKNTEILLAEFKCFLSRQTRMWGSPLPPSLPPTVFLVSKLFVGTLFKMITLTSCISFNPVFVYRYLLFPPYKRQPVRIQK